MAPRSPDTRRAFSLKKDEAMEVLFVMPVVLFSLAWAAVELATGRAYAAGTGLRRYYVTRTESPRKFWHAIVTKLEFAVIALVIAGVFRAIQP